MSHTLSENPLECMQIDEIGPLFLGNRNGYTKIWVVVAIEVVARKIHLVPIKSQDTISFIQVLEILQSCRGCLMKIVIDAHPSHVAVHSNENDDITLKSVSPTLKGILDRGKSNILKNRGVSLVVANGIQHSKVGLVEQSIWNIKSAHQFISLQTTL